MVISIRTTKLPIVTWELVKPGMGNGETGNGKWEIEHEK